MNLKKLLFGALSVGLMTACSNDLPDTPNGGQTGGDGYIAVRINMPTDPGTRAGNNDITSDGTDNEYRVIDGVIVLFQKKADQTEAEAKLVGAYDLETLQEFPDVNDNQITNSYLKAIKINSVDPKDGDLYGLVMLNCGNIVDVASATQLNVYTSASKDFKAVSTFKDLVEGLTYAESAFYKAATDDENSNAAYFFMANAPMSDVRGGEGATAATAANIHTLVSMKNSVYTTEAEAKNKPAACFYVERGVAKVTISFKDGKTGNVLMDAQTVDANGNVVSISQPAFVELGYALGNTEAQSYIVRNMGDMSYLGYNVGGNYRMVGHTYMPATSIEQENQNLYRTYWCIDPNYTDDKTNNDSKITKYVTEGPLYCHENTFDVAHMNHKNTTRGLIKLNVEIGGQGATYYTINNDQRTIYLDEAKAESKSRNYILNSPVIKTALEGAMLEGKKVTINSDNMGDYIVVKFNRQADGYRRVESITLKPNAAKVDMSIFDPAKLIDGVIAFDDLAVRTAVNDAFKIAEYQGGINYYDFRFRHFDDVLTPWDKTKVKFETTPSVIEAYGYSTNQMNDFLGRYGLVRNNWYDVTIDQVKKLGMPEVTDITAETPDDEKNDESWISFHINVLSWAKRTQHVDL